jgi:hypothetical protein
MGMNGIAIATIKPNPEPEYLEVWYASISGKIPNKIILIRISGMENNTFLFFIKLQKVYVIRDTRVMNGSSITIHTKGVIIILQSVAKQSPKVHFP